MTPDDDDTEDPIFSEASFRAAQAVEQGPGRGPVHGTGRARRRRS
jgi:hypothetical protein